VVVASNCSVEVIVSDVGDMGGADDAGGVGVPAVAANELV
jgi:hypothetical protein